MTDELGVLESLDEQDQRLIEAVVQSCAEEILPVTQKVVIAARNEGNSPAGIGMMVSGFCVAVLGLRVTDAVWEKLE